MAPTYGAGIAAAGERGEHRTADILEHAYRGDDTTHVFHDLDIPGHERTANVDHMVAQGNRVIILDSKSWLPGFYWTARGCTYRGLHRFPPADKHTVGFAVDSYRQLLLGNAKVGGMLVIHPTRDGPNHLWAIALADGVARATGDKLIAALERRLGPAAAPPDPRLIDTLVGYVRRPEPPIPPATWYPDPTLRNQLRYWDGTNWTHWTSNNGHPNNDPI
jgi:hypothetical protein